MAHDKQFQRECQAAFLMVKEKLDARLSSVDELGLALQQAGRNPSRRMLMEYWTSSNGGVSFAQFCGILKGLNQTSAEQLRDAFRRLDRNHDGHISFEELKTTLLKKDEKFTDDELRQIFAGADINRDGKVNYDEFVRLMCETMEETKRQALARLEKRERHEARQKKRERREQALNGPVTNGQSTKIASSRHRHVDELSLSSDGSAAASASGVQLNKGHTALPVPQVSPKPSTNEQFKHCVKRKGCLLYDIDLDDDVGRAEIVSHQYKITLKHNCKISVTIRPTGVPDLRGPETVDTLLVIVDHQGRICAFTKDKEKVTYSVRSELAPGEYRLIPFTTGCRFRPRAAETAVNTKPKAELLTKGKDGLLKLTKEFRLYS